MSSTSRPRSDDFIPKIITTLRNGYGTDKFLKDLAAGITVGMVALPLAMAFAIASGVPPERGLFTAIVAGFAISALSGSRFQIGGPTGAFVVIIAGAVAQYGYEGLVAATLIAGVLLLIMGFAKFGRYIKFIPYPVTTGFTAGIGLLIFSSQIKDLLGLPLTDPPAGFLEKWEAYLHCGAPDPSTALLGVGTLAVMLFVRRFIPKIPAPLAGVVLGSVAVAVLGLPVETIGSRFGGVPATLPHFDISLPSWDVVRQIFPTAFTIAMLAGIESLLSAVVADGMTGERHNANTELVGQGFANIISVCFGGIPATGAIARTATNIKCGAYSPLSGIIHAAMLLLFLMFLAPMADGIPLCSLAAVLSLVAWDMSEVRKFKRLLTAPRRDVVVMLLTFCLTILVDLVVAVEVGVVLAAFLFMRRMSEIIDVSRPHWLRLSEEEPQTNGNGKQPVPQGVDVYQINGPFFFGVADRLHDVLGVMQHMPKVFVLRMKRVGAVDATGLNALESFITTCRKHQCDVLLAEVVPNVRRAIVRMHTDVVIGVENIYADLDTAMARAREIVEEQEAL